MSMHATEHLPRTKNEEQQNCRQSTQVPEMSIESNASHPLSLH